jgi:hypothetical protein
MTNPYKQFQNECAGTDDPAVDGLMKVSIYKNDDILDLLMRRDKQSVQHAKACLKTLFEAFEKGNTKEPPFCGACDYEFKSAYDVAVSGRGVVLCTPIVDDPVNIVSSVLCAECAQLPYETVLDRAIGYLMQGGLAKERIAAPN